MADHKKIKNLANTDIQEYIPAISFENKFLANIISIFISIESNRTTIKKWNICQNSFLKSDLS
jgi:hypothetical protein